MSGLTPAPDGYPIKLVRDNTPRILNATGIPGALFYGETPEGDLIPALRQKLGEEVVEYLLGGTADELADVYAAVQALAELHGVDLDALVAADPRGGFRDGVMMYGHHLEFDGRET